MNIKNLLFKYGRIVVGGALIGAALQFFLIPNNMVLGGTSGLAVIISYLTGLPPGLLIFLMNAPLLLLALRILGFFPTLTCALGIVSTSVLVDALTPFRFVVTEDLLLVAVYSGILVGLGVGGILSAGSSAGGTDMAARLIRTRKPDLSMGVLIFIIDSCIVIAGVFVFGRYDIAMYAVLSIFLFNRIVDFILYGMNYAKVVYIISDQGPRIRERIVMDLGRGVTVLHGEGGYSGKEKQVLICAIKQKQQITELKRLVHREDPAAFFIIHEAREIVGKGFGAVE